MPQNCLFRRHLCFQGCCWFWQFPWKNILFLSETEKANFWHLNVFSFTEYLTTDFEINDLIWTSFLGLIWKEIINLHFYYITIFMQRDIPSLVFVWIFRRTAQFQNTLLRALTFCWKTDSSYQIINDNYW